MKTSKLESLQTILTSALVTLILGLGTLAVRSVHYPSNSQTDNQKKNPKEEQGAAYNMPLVLGGKIGKFLDDHNGAIIATFTILLATFTVRLAIATDRLVKGSEITAKRQLRAYINLEHVSATDTPNGCNIVIRMRNYGLTPAYDVSAVGELDIVNFPINIAPLAPLGDNEPGSKETWGPQGFADIPMSIHPIRMRTERDAILNGKKATVVRARLTYRDAFGEKHTTNVHRFSHGPAWQRLLFAAHYEGNECD